MSGRESANEAPRALVIGQGAAGLTAALVLAREGAKVTSISKVRPGGATCTIYAGGGFTLGIEGMSPEQHRKMTYETGRRLNVPELLDAFSREGPSIVEFLAGAGVPFRVHLGGLSVRRDPAFPLLGGKSLTDGLHRACVAQGVAFLTDLVAMRILSDDRGAGGVECIDHSAGKALVLRAGAVVLATGGGGAIYERTDNPRRITGDGYRLALDASCHLLDMEFVQFYPIGFDTPGGAHWFMGLDIIDRARVTDPSGREFLKEMLLNEGILTGREANLLARDKCSVAIALENEKGQSLLHLEDIPEEEWRRSTHLQNIARMFPPSSPPWKGPVPLHPIEHYFPGGVVIGTDGQTEVPGLFACGEVTGGVDGANRVGGNALTNCVLFGQKAARAAARYARGEHVTLAEATLARPAPPEAAASAGRAPGHAEGIDLPPARSAQAWLDIWNNNASRVAKGSGGSGPSESISPSNLRARFRDFSTRYLLPLRRGDALEEAQTAVAVLGNLLGKQAVKDSRDLLLASENLGLWYTAALVSRAAFIRRESRGAHYRVDYPHEDPAWEKHVYQGNDGGVLKAVVS
jgi:succinate dehydrogenase/fumarate reductase flavoprotein subunit